VLGLMEEARAAVADGTLDRLLTATRALWEG